MKILYKTKKAAIIKTDKGNRHISWENFNKILKIDKNNPNNAEIIQENVLKYYEAEILISRILHLVAKGIECLDDNIAMKAFRRELCEKLGISQMECVDIISERMDEMENRIVNMLSEQQISIKKKEVPAKSSEEPVKEEDSPIDVTLGISSLPNTVK